MSSISTIKFSNGCVVGLGSMVCSTADVIFPVDTIKKMSATDIGRIAKELCEGAETQYLREVADMCDSESYLKYSPDDHLEILREQFSQVGLNLPDLREFREKIEIELLRRQEREKQRANLKGRRKQIQRVRNKLFIEIGNRDGFICKFCQAVKDLTLDHIHPVIEGGTDALENLQILCRSCNSRKSDRVTT